MNKKVMNAIIKKMAAKQNKNTKLNGGQLREAASLFMKAVVELSTEEKLALVSKLSK